MERIGFIGLGIMGSPMSQHLLKAGYALTVLDRVTESQKQVIAAGAQAGASPKQVAEQSEVVITMLPDSPDVEEVVLGKNGVLEGLRPGSLFIDMSTILPSVARRVTDAVRKKGADGDKARALYLHDVCAEHLEGIVMIGVENSIQLVLGDSGLHGSLLGGAALVGIIAPIAAATNLKLRPRPVPKLAARQLSFWRLHRCR